MARRTLLLYAAAMIVAGLTWGWGAPLGSDEERYYLPAAKFFAERGFTIDYPMPMPPFALVVQGFVYRLSESVYVLRMISTFAAIGAAAVFALILTTVSSRSTPVSSRAKLRDPLRLHDDRARSGDPSTSLGMTHEGTPGAARSPRRWMRSFGVLAPQDDSRAWLLLMFGTFPAALMNAFSLKHHSIVLLCCVAAFALWQRQRIAFAAVVLAIGALTHQITCAMIGTLVVLSLFDRRYRDAAILSLSALPLAALILAWGGARPPMHETTFTGEPSMSGLQPAQILVLLFMAGTWIAPALRLRWIAAAIALPCTAIWMHTAGLMRYSDNVYGRLAGPVTSAIAAATRQQFLLAAIAAGALAALGVALFWTAVAPATALTRARNAGESESGSSRCRTPKELAVWAAMYALVMLAVPYFFESYYALFVALGWVMLRDEIAARPPWFPIAATMAGIGYVVVKA